jgi:hypothetical protein
MVADSARREHGNAPARCPITGRPCEGDLAHLCEDYGCARKAGLSPHSMTYKGQCFCGAVQLEVSGEPAAMGYCHCRSCRSWSGGPVNAFTLWQPNAVKVTAGADQIATYEKTLLSQRKSCKKCGGHLMTNHPPLNLVDVLAATLPTLRFEPGVHVNYAETVLPMRDGLPKLKDFPREFGGSGETVPE